MDVVIKEQGLLTSRIGKLHNFQNDLFDLLNHIHIWSVSPHRSTSNCQVWTWYATVKQYFNDNENQTKEITKEIALETPCKFDSHVNIWVCWRYITQIYHTDQDGMHYAFGTGKFPHVDTDVSKIYFAVVAFSSLRLIISITIYRSVIYIYIYIYID